MSRCHLGFFMKINIDYINIEITPAQCGHTNENTNKVLRA